MTPRSFPRAVDRTAHIVLPVSRPDELRLIDLTPLHFALDAYISKPDERSMAEVRRHLALVQAATAGEHLSFDWRDMHLFATILLDAEQWHPVLT